MFRLRATSYAATLEFGSFVLVLVYIDIYMLRETSLGLQLAL